MRSLVDIVLVGLERAGDIAEHEESAALVKALNVAPPPEQRLLLQLGIAGIRARAGRRAGSAPRPAPAPAESRAECSQPLAQLVADLCREKQGALLAEAIARLDALDLRLPASCLVELAMVKDAGLQPAAGRVAGERGRWLAAHNPEWRWLIEGETALASGDRRKTWEEGALPSRLAALRAARAEAPAEGRAWVESVWKEEKAAIREQMLDALESGLSLEDEAFLVLVLGDRAGPVRAKAAALLARLEDSALAKRMRERSARGAPRLHRPARRCARRPRRRSRPSWAA